MRKPKKLLTLLGVALALSGASQASAGSLSPTLLQKARAGDQTPTGVIVRFNVADTAQGRALFKNLRGQLNSQIAKLGPSAGFLKQAVNSQKATQLWLDQSIYLPMTPVQARAVSLLPFVSEVFENFKVQIPRAAALSTTSAPAGTPAPRPRRGSPPRCPPPPTRAGGPTTAPAPRSSPPWSACYAGDPGSRRRAVRRSRRSRLDLVSARAAGHPSYRSRTLSCPVIPLRAPPRWNESPASPPCAWN